jgi:hypothetical protein
VVANSLPAGSQPDGDANLYYPTIGGDAAPDKMIKFKGTHRAGGHDGHTGGHHEAEGAADLPVGTKRIDPHAVCFSSCLGQSTCS